VALYPKRLKSAYISVLVGNGAQPEVFTKICGATQRGFTIQKNTTDEFIQPCDNPEAVPSRVLQVTGIQWDMTLNIVYNRTQAPLIRELMEIDDPRNFRLEFLEPENDAIDSGYFAGAGQATNLQITADDGSFVSGTMAITSDGDWVWTDAA
jgi:hypothetical protein